MLLERLFTKRETLEVKKYFNEIASQWDSMSKEFYSLTVRDKILELIDLQPGKIIADIGAGTGFLTEGLSKGPASIIAIDQSREMLKHMQRKFRGNHNIDYRPGEASHLPVKDGIVDYALANMYLHHVENPPAAIQDIYRILNKGGKLILTDLESHEFEFLRKEQHDIWLGFNHGVISEWMETAGFSNVSVESIQEYCCTVSSNRDREPKISIFMAQGEKS